MSEPKIKLEKRKKYASVDYDMYVTSYNLKEEIAKKLRKIFRKIVRKSLQKEKNKKDTAYCSAGTISGFVNNLLIEDAERLFERIKPIIKNKENWVPCAGKELLDKYEKE